ncbi:hypothetical protein AJ80_08061 [Polytolypa hystricis UAMH7299]|uniref:Vacuolar protein sorting-associated protein 54 n=1 Tax=Polytolypa hystricis (strain UAMH7299) TaxID=1447883 RepID=A0A2B7XEG6_POLH7|nr:hypothetical protein AJ80_08061 [Polytolypa hystricis UAMH7299]
MTSPDPRKSVESLTSSPSVISLSQFSQSHYDSARSFQRSRYDSRRSSNASSITAISTLLQPPIVRTGLFPHTSAPSSGYKPPSTRDIPPVTLTNISHVESKAFHPYLSQVGSLYDALRRAKDNGEEGDTQSIRKGKTGSKQGDIEALLGSQSKRRQSSDSSSQKRAPSHRGAAPLSTIPNIYFDEGFQLENPRTFDIVSERSEVITPSPKPSADSDANGSLEGRQPTNRKALATNAILQEKLSWYLDTVEIHLISSISTASTTFFTALGSLRDLHAEATASVQKIQTLRSDLNKLDDEMALGGLKVVNLRRRRENVRKLAGAINQLKEVITAVSQCEDMVENGEIEDALDELDDVERLIAGEIPSKPRQGLITGLGQGESIIDLRGIKALDGASDDLALLRSRIGTAYERRFLDCLMDDLKRHMESVPSNVTLLRLGDAFHRTRRGTRSVPSGVPAYANVDSQLRGRLRMELAGLGRAGYTSPAATSFKNVVLREMKNSIRRHLPSSSDDDNESIMSSSTHGSRQMSQQEKSTILARNLRLLDPDDAHDMLVKIYTGISESLRRLSVQVKLLLDITSGLGNPKSPPRSPSMQSLDGLARSNTSTLPLIAQDEIMQILDMSSLLGQAVDIVQSQIFKILKVRSEQTAHLSLEQFLRYFSLNKLFADECEAISGRSGTALKTMVDTQIRDFISSFGDFQKHRIVQVMDSDKWDARDFGEEENAILARVLEASTRDVEAWAATSMIWQSSDQSQEGAQTSTNAMTNGNGAPVTSKDKIRRAVVDEQQYILPQSALLTLRVMEDFQHLTTGIPGMAQDIAMGFLDCLKLFNSRSSQLILGAGATRSAGLKRITTKHLSLALQALSFITALIPYVREFIRRHCTAGSLMTEFDKVKRLYQEHQSGIHEKLVDIMGSRATAHANSMKQIDWDADGDAPAVNSYMEVLTQETGTLHRVLAKHLPDSTVMMIMIPVFTSYRDQWTNAYQSVTLKSEKGRQRMLADVEFFKSKVDKINGAEGLGDHLLAIVKAKPIAATPTQSNNNNNNGNNNHKLGTGGSTTSSSPSRSPDPPATPQPEANGTAPQKPDE